MKSLLALLLAIPDLLKLIREIQKKHKQACTEKKVKEDIKKITKAFEENDAKALNDVFDS